jgi:HEAT repeat protein
MSTATDATIGAPLLDGETTARLLAFARACRAAARAVALYPAEHPTVASTLAQVATAANQAAAVGEFKLGVFPDTLSVAGRKPPRPDLAVTELAALLHARQVGLLTIQPQSTADEWRRFLSLAALPPEQARRRGGLSRLWASEGQTRIQARQIDYSLLFVDRTQGDRATWDTIVAQCLEGDAGLCDDTVVNLVMELLDRPENAGRLLTAVAERTETAGGNAAVVIAGVLHALAEFVRRTNPDHLEPLLIAIADTASRLPTDTLAAIATRGRSRAGQDPEGFVAHLARRMTDESLADHIAGAILSGQGTSPDLDDFVAGFIPDVDRRSSVLALARHMLAHTDAALPTATLQAQIERLVNSHDDRPFISDAYTAELQQAAARAVDLERDVTDSTEAIAAWRQTVSDEQVRALDGHLLVDLMQLKRDLPEWQASAALVRARIAALVAVGDFTGAAFLVEALRLQYEDHPNTDVRSAAAQVLDDLLRDDLVRPVATHLDTADTAVTTAATRLCHALGAAVVPSLAEVLSREDRARARQHLVTILNSFGAAGRQAVERLMQSSSAAVRRTAVLLLREFGGEDALPKLESMLHDTEPRVQREATRAVVVLGVEAAHASLARVLVEGHAASRAAITSVLWSLPLEDTVPVLCHLVARAPQDGDMYGIQERAIQRLGGASSEVVVRALATALARGSLRAPLRTRALRRRSAESLARIGTAAALDVLRAAAIGGSWGVRRAARTALASGRTGTGHTAETDE